MKSRILLPVLAMAFFMAACGAEESAPYNLNLDSVAQSSLDPSLCSLIYIKNMVRSVITSHNNGDTPIQGRSRNVKFLPPTIHYKIFNSATQSVHVEKTTTSPSALEYEGTVEFRVEFDPEANPGALQLPYYKAEVTMVPDFSDDGYVEDKNPPKYATSSENGEGRCGSTYYYTAWSPINDADKLTNVVGAFISPTY
jgi:hypothetical protein